MRRRPPSSAHFPYTTLFRPGVAVLGGIFLVAMSAMKSSDVYKGVLERARSNPEAVAALGEPIKDGWLVQDRKSTRLNSSHANISYAVFCLKKKKYYSNSSQ